MAVIWKTMIGISGLGIITLFFLKEVPMNMHTDENFGLTEAEKERKRQADEEKTISGDNGVELTKRTVTGSLEN